MFRKKRLQTTPTKYPDGLAVRAGDKTYYVKGGHLYTVPTLRVLDSWSFYTIETTPAAIKDFKVAGILGFRDGTLLRDISDGKLYLVSGNRKRHIVSPDVFDKYGLNPNRVVTVSKGEIDLHNDGEPLE